MKYRQAAAINTPTTVATVATVDDMLPQLSGNPMITRMEKKRRGESRRITNIYGRRSLAPSEVDPVLTMEERF